MTAPIGFLVVLRDPEDRLTDDWDGEVHPDLEAGLASAHEALDAGWVPILCELHPIAPQPREADHG